MHPLIGHVSNCHTSLEKKNSSRHGQTKVMESLGLQLHGMEVAPQVDNQFLHPFLVLLLLSWSPLSFARMYPKRFVQQTTWSGWWWLRTKKPMLIDWTKFHTVSQLLVFFKLRWHWVLKLGQAATLIWFYAHLSCWKYQRLNHILILARSYEVEHGP